MIKLDPHPTFLEYPPKSGTDLEANRRLIVLVPSCLDDSAATRRIWELAHTFGMDVQFLALCKDASQEASFRRRLITMTSMLQDGKRSVEAKVGIGTNWLKAVKSLYKAGDLIVCFSEQHTSPFAKPLSQILESNFSSTVYVLSGLAPQTSKPDRLRQSSAWLGSIGIIIGFGLLQAKAIQFSEGGLQNLLFILSIFAEFWLIWVWNSLFG